MEIKYTDEQAKELVDGYVAATTHDERDDYILIFMGKHKKSKKSVIAKLSKCGKYIVKPKLSKVTGGTPETKKQMLEKIALKLGMSVEELEGVDKSPKLSLQNMLKRLSE